MNVLTLKQGGNGEMLPVFSYEEEAETFLRLGGAPGTGWCAREITSGELTSMLYGHCACVERVALDPLPIVDGEVMANLANLERERFVRNLMGLGDDSLEDPS